MPCGRRYTSSAYGRREPVGNASDGSCFWSVRASSPAHSNQGASAAPRSGQGAAHTRGSKLPGPGFSFTHPRPFKTPGSRRPRLSGEPRPAEFDKRIRLHDSLKSGTCSTQPDVSTALLGKDFEYHRAVSVLDHAKLACRCAGNIDDSVLGVGSAIVDGHCD